VNVKFMLLEERKALIDAPHKVAGQDKVKSLNIK
jgi:hypothetical protein